MREKGRRREERKQDKEDRERRKCVCGDYGSGMRFEGEDTSVTLPHVNVGKYVQCESAAGRLHGRH